MEEQNDILVHHGLGHDDDPPGRGSGRWPWGGGDKPFQRPKDFLEAVKRLEAMGKTPKEIAASVGIFSRDSRRKYEGSPSRLKIAIRIAQHEEKLKLIKQARELSEKHIGATEGAKILGLKNESSFRSLLKEGSETMSKSARETADSLKAIIDKEGPKFVGEGVSYQLNITEDRFKEALEILYFDGYEILPGRIKQPNNPKHATTVTVLAPPGTPPSVAYDPTKYSFIGDNYISHDGVNIEKGFQYPTSLDSSRLMVRYPKDGGAVKDGLVELRPGVKDIDLGEGVHYSQVRILVDGTHYIKGMAVYGDPKDFPPGIDLIFNTSKPDGTPLKNPDPNGKQVLKNIGKDPNNPFESAIKEHGGQMYWEDDKGEKHLSLINKRADEGDWMQWSKKFPAQFLSKQPIEFINRQLGVSKKESREELDNILALTNDNVKKLLLDKFANTADTKAADLSATSSTGTMYQVLLPINSLGDNEVYAPNFKHGETISLIRFPLAGVFEIATVIVNNNNPDGDRMITKDAKDAIGVNAKTLKKMSGADTDGDTALVIPHRNGIVVDSAPSLPGLENFDIEMEYGDHEGNIHMKKGRQQQNQMGRVTNLIADMGILGGTIPDYEKATKHSMVVIDAVKHGYDWKKSEINNEIDLLKRTYQKKKAVITSNRDYGGASTLITRAGADKRIQGEIKEGEYRYDPKTGKNRLVRIDPETGKQLWRIEDEPYRFYMDPNDRDENGKKIKEADRRMFKTSDPNIYRSKDGTKLLPKDQLVLSKEYHKSDSRPAMFFVDDAKELLSVARHPIEMAYADYANYMKSLANEARKATLNLSPIIYSPQANRTYITEVDSLNKKYVELEKRKPIEAEALAEADTMIKGWYAENPGATSEQQGKAKQRLISYCRQKRGLIGGENTLEITPKEWEAIQAGAISSTRLNKLLTRADVSVIQQYAMPRGRGLTPTQKTRILNMKANGASNGAIAEALEISVTTVNNFLKGDDQVA